MDEKEFADTLWICLYTDDTGIGIVGVFSTEEAAFAALPDVVPEGQYWMCPTDKDVRVGSPEDRFSELPERAYPVFALELEVTKPPKKKAKPSLKIVK